MIHESVAFIRRFSCPARRTGDPMSQGYYYWGRGVLELAWHWATRSPHPGHRLAKCSNHWCSAFTCPAIFCGHPHTQPDTTVTAPQSHPHTMVAAPTPARPGHGTRGLCMLWSCILATRFSRGSADLHVFTELLAGGQPGCCRAGGDGSVNYRIVGRVATRPECEADCAARRRCLGYEWYVTSV